MASFTDGGFPNMAEIASRSGRKEEALAITNVLERKKPILKDIPFYPSNLAQSHEIDLALYALPSGTWAKINQGVVPTKGQTAIFTESVSNLEALTVIDDRLVKKNGGFDTKRGKSWMVSEEMLHLEGLAQQMETATFYS